MQPSFSFIKIFFLCLCAFFSITYAISDISEGEGYNRLLIASLVGVAFGYAVISLGNFFKTFNLRIFNITALGLLFGYFMGEIIWNTFQSTLLPIFPRLTDEIVTLTRIGIFLTSAYLGLFTTFKASEELYFSVPFIKFQANTQKKKDFLIEPSILLDPRIIDLANSGILDSSLIIPRCLIKECTENVDNPEETIRSRVKRSLETIKKLESFPNLDLRYTEVDFPEIDDPIFKYVKLAQLLNANILTADANRLNQSNIDGVKLVNINALSSPFKPLTHLGESIFIKIQRYGKDPRQGIGYLEDGTMVVVNGGAEYIGESIRAQILSVKHTSSGRMIFCNATDDHSTSESALATVGENTDNMVKNYFAH